MAGPLQGVRVLEFAGMGPGPFAAMLLADMGAEVIRLDRPGRTDAGAAAASAPNPVLRGRRSVAVDLKHPAALPAVLRLIASADVLVEGYRPGVMERLGLSPESCWERNAALVYGRATGWGQSGPYAQRAGHDINYLALSGALDPIGSRGGPPVPPVNLLGDYAGGGLYLAFGLVAAVLEARSSGTGQVVDGAIVDGAAHMTTTLHWKHATGSWNTERGTNILDGGAHFYGVYETADGGHVTVGALEPQFYAEVRRILQLDGPEWDDQRNPRLWPELTRKLADLFRTRTREEWCARFADFDACFAPVLTLDEVAGHEHHTARGTFVVRDGVTEPLPAPRLSRTPGRLPAGPPRAGEHTEEVLREAGFDEREIGELRAEAFR
ncbi:CaiB/BaiF CoA transferase family protein [Streptomyces sulphureus]|uniref:CaiB/BaiF CoA transferase family protein n=1 Tax=Streptomyces sulphureus TaxID=47758 RepID=UPI0003A12B8D|nr:CaiB/BaiF CoA-transferase family protein [Streptomyces sulphureus]